MSLRKVLERNALGFISKLWLREVLPGKMEVLRQGINCSGWMGTALWELLKRKPQRS